MKLVRRSIKSVGPACMHPMATTDIEYSDYIYDATRRACVVNLRVVWYHQQSCADAPQATAIPCTQ